MQLILHLAVGKHKFRFYGLPTAHAFDQQHGARVVHPRVLLRELGLQQLHILDFMFIRLQCHVFHVVQGEFTHFYGFVVQDHLQVGNRAGLCLRGGLRGVRAATVLKVLDAQEQGWDVFCCIWMWV